jgi:hypothetical protein
VPGGTGGELIINPNAQPPGDKFYALSEAEPRFLESWNRTRKDMKDTSPSGWDFSLCNYAVSAGWTDQEIVDLLVAARVKNGDDLKRPQYYRTTIDFVRVDNCRNTALQEIVEATSLRGTDEPAPKLNDEQRKDLLDKISNAIGVRIIRIIRYKQDPPRYRLVSQSGEIELGAVSNLVEQTPLRYAIAATEGIYMRKFKAQEWNGIAQSLLNACESYDIGPEGTDIGQTKAWLSVYLDENKPGAESDATISNQDPFYDESGTVFIFLSHFRLWLKTKQDEKISARQLGVLLRKIGCDPESIGFAGSTRNVWKTPVKVKPTPKPEPSGNGQAGHVPDEVERVFK